MLTKGCIFLARCFGLSMLDFDRLPHLKPYSFKIFKCLAVWAQAYGVSERAIIRQLPIAEAWLASNEERCPKKNMTRFLNTWMKRAKEFGNLKEDSSFKAYVESRPDDSELPDADFFKELRNKDGNG